jgi:hypothetical protein
MPIENCIDTVGVLCTVCHEGYVVNPNTNQCDVLIIYRGNWVTAVMCCFFLLVCFVILGFFCRIWWRKRRARRNDSGFFTSESTKPRNIISNEMQKGEEYTGVFEDQNTNFQNDTTRDPSESDSFPEPEIRI